MTKLTNAELKARIPDRLERIEILLDGKEDLGVKGIRCRLNRVERVTVGLIVMNSILLLKLTLLPELDVLAAITAFLVP